MWTSESPRPWHPQHHCCLCLNCKNHFWNNSKSSQGVPQDNIKLSLRQLKVGLSPKEWATPSLTSWQHQVAQKGFARWHQVLPQDNSHLCQSFDPKTSQPGPWYELGDWTPNLPCFRLPMPPWWSLAQVLPCASWTDMKSACQLTPTLITKVNIAFDALTFCPWWQAPICHTPITSHLLELTTF